MPMAVLEIPMAGVEMPTERASHAAAEEGRDDLVRAASVPPPKGEAREQRPRLGQRGGAWPGPGMAASLKKVGRQKSGEKSSCGTIGVGRREPGGGKPVRRRVERPEPEDLDEDPDEDSSGDETEKHTFDTRA